MSANEAQARIKINRLLEQENWRFFDNESGRWNEVWTKEELAKYQENFEKLKKLFPHCITPRTFLCELGY